MNKRDADKLNSNNYNINRKRRLEESPTAKKRLRINHDNSNEYSYEDKRPPTKQNSLYYEPVSNTRISPNAKSYRSFNTQPPSKTFSANERLNTIRKNLQLSVMNSVNNSNKRSPNVTSPVPSNKHFHHTATVTAKPSSLKERLNTIRGSLSSAYQVPYSYFTGSQSSTTNVTPEPVFESPTKVNTSNDSDLSMDWSYIEEKKILTKINEMRNEDIITRVTPSSKFQECIAKELEPILHNDTILKDIYVVVDTNIFISHLDVIGKVLGIKVNGVAAPIILIPWIVIQELDFLKESRTDSKLKRKSQSAIHFINDKLSKKHPQVKGQSVRDAAKQNFSSKNADDSILHCCLQIIGKQNRAMLLSNDINLRNKAIIHNVDAYSHTEIIDTLDPYRGLSNNADICRGKDIELCFRNLFSFIIFTQLRESYGATLSTVHPDVKNPPWTLIKCLNLFQKFWQPIFSMFLQKQFIHKVGQCADLINKFGNLDALQPLDLRAFIEYGFGICIYLKNALPANEDSIVECMSSVENIAESLSLPDFFIKI
ncbi:hypothetical protein RN001_009437 [Aquatica leii]|uniref:PIN domain-containing protein n=1 Tax=Aquatica leii TaxID=1421715 RepID=A0AAN7S858_9COLE|nr:hypothetical protein RN001_009437 [Aquatica leii]